MNSCTYEVNTGLGRGFKLQDSFLGYSTPWTQTYGYDPNLDYLISVSYGDGQANASQTWTYDAAGNRTSDYTGSGWTYDNLNRMTASPNTTYTNDILGNRTATTKTIQSGGGVTGTQSGSMTWDCLNRMVSATAPGALAHTNYEYRADGMRVQKSYYSGTIASEPLGGPASAGGLATSSAITATAAAGASVATTSAPTQTTGVGDVLTTYRYDGQMPFEIYAAHDDGSSVLSDHAIGMRGVDSVQLQSLSTSGQLTTTVDYPLYDAHGNELATLSRSASSYALGNERTYGVWGEIRQGASSGGPRGRYCGNLGHVQDDETNLIYMRARYYEPTSGRFISEDTEGHGLNWFAYCLNAPTVFVDESGHDEEGGADNGILALLQIFSAAAGGLLGYTVITKFFEFMYPSYKGSLFVQLGSAVLPLVRDLTTKGGDIEPLLNKSVVELAKDIASYLLSNGGQTAAAAAGACGMTFMLGLICGIYAASLEFYCSDTWQNDVGPTYFNP